MYLSRIYFYTSVFWWWLYDWLFSWPSRERARFSASRKSASRRGCDSSKIKAACTHASGRMHAIQYIIYCKGEREKRAGAHWSAATGVASRSVSRCNFYLCCCWGRELPSDLGSTKPSHTFCIERKKLEERERERKREEIYPRTSNADVRIRQVPVAHNRYEMESGD